MISSGRSKLGFTIVELLIVVVVIAILATITVVAYNGIQDRSKNSQVQSDMRNVAQLIGMYHADQGSYPSTGGLSRVYVDANCIHSTDSDGYKGVEWVPSLSAYANALPQNKGLTGTGRSGVGGCYTYASDGTNYILSAWNARRGGPGTDSMYRRVGWRETYFFNANSYLCNHSYIGGTTSGVYDPADDFYKQSYTISSITGCDETPPPGA